MGKNIKRYLLLFLLFVKMGLMKQTAYRTHFILMVLGKIIRIALIFLFFQAIFLKIDKLGHWKFEHILLLFATFHMIDFIISITFQRNLSYYLPNLIRTGELDMRMIRPVNLLFFLSFERIDFMDFFSFIPCFAFLIYVLYKLNFSFSVFELFIYILLVLNALVFLYAMILLIATVSFWTTHSFGLARIFDNLLKISRYPLDIFEGFWRTIFIYFLPLVIIAQIPSKILLGGVSFWSALGPFCATLLFLMIALKFWRLGLRNYLSVGS